MLLHPLPLSALSVPFIPLHTYIYARALLPALVLLEIGLRDKFFQTELFPRLLVRHIKPDFPRMLLECDDLKQSIYNPPLIYRTPTVLKFRAYYDAARRQTAAND